VLGTIKPGDGTVVVHRCGCPELPPEAAEALMDGRALKALNDGEGDLGLGIPTVWAGLPPREASSSSGTGVSAGAGSSASGAGGRAIDDGGPTFTSELQVFCDDRKFLLRDVSNVVALMADIESTQSQTINQVAMLQYRVSVTDIGELEQLIAAIEEVPGVISVERILARSSKS